MTQAEVGDAMFDFLLTDQQRRLRDEVRALVAWVPRDLIVAMDRDEVRFPTTFLEEAGRRNLMGCRYPARWGGRDLDWVATCVAMEEVATLGYIFGCVFGVGAELVCDAIVQHGTDQQRERYVVPLLRGERFAAECLTEPRGGSDFFGTTTTAHRRGDEWVLNGSKRFIVGAEAADFFLVYARTDDNPDASPREQLSCFVVDRGPGVSVEYHYGLMGCRGGGTARLSFRDVELSRDSILGPVGGGGDVFDTMMIPERLGTAAMTIGAARPALEIATRYTSRRKAFGRPINQFQGVSFQIADAAMLLDAARAAVDTTARAVDAGVETGRVRRMVSQTKKFVTESCQEVAHRAMQVMGGIAYTDVFPIERIVRDLRLASIWTGTNEIMASIVAHEWYAEHETGLTIGARDHEADAAAADAEAEKVYG